MTIFSIFSSKAVFARGSFILAHFSVAIFVWWLASIAVFNPLKEWDDVLADKARQIVLFRTALSRLTNPTIGPPQIEPDGARLAHRGDMGVIDLQNRLRAVTDASGVQVQSTEALPDRTDGPLSVAALSVDVQGEGSSLQRLLHDLENGMPWVTVASVTMRALPPLDHQTEPQIHLRMDIQAVEPPAAQGSK